MSANGILYIYTVYIDDVYRYLILRSITHTGTHHQSLYIKAYGDISNALLVYIRYAYPLPCVWTEAQIDWPYKYEWIMKWVNDPPILSLLLLLMVLVN